MLVHGLGGFNDFVNICDVGGQLPQCNEKSIFAFDDSNNYFIKILTGVRKTEKNDKK